MLLYPLRATSGIRSEANTLTPRGAEPARNRPCSCRAGVPPKPQQTKDLQRLARESAHSVAYHILQDNKQLCPKFHLEHIPHFCADCEPSVALSRLPSHLTTLMPGYSGSPLTQ